MKVENSDYAKFVNRVIRAYGRRAADGDVSTLADLAQLRTAVDEALHSAVHDLRADYGYSWADIGRELGITRASAHERFSRTDNPYTGTTLGKVQT